ncbi:hypothetical protein [Sinorhizobium fredii]|nr:hypothetical protein [Sinorhizobium fredii]
MAAVCSVSPTSVTRVATALGFDGFRDFKLFFQQHLRRTANFEAGKCF